MLNPDSDNEDILFNSVSNNEFKYLSNFYGDVEICFMQKRFKNKKMKQLFNKFKTCDSNTFKKFLQLLQPDKVFTKSNSNYWFDKKINFDVTLSFNKFRNIYE